MNTLIKILKDIGLITVITAALITLGKVINNVLPWDKVTSLFSIMRYFNNTMDWFVPVNTALWPALGLSLLLAGAEWAFWSGLIPVRWLKKKDE